jgi:hypothetical protein
LTDLNIETSIVTESVNVRIGQSTISIVVRRRLPQFRVTREIVLNPELCAGLLEKRLDGPA